ncbi:fructose-bisphosphatase class III [Clostridium sp.]|nr:fructose-bisphosphatase class III [uncultured Clostridium sp.]MBS4973790.1 fructose-bisphosphatase class III [Clostridium celatum]
MALYTLIYNSYGMRLVAHEPFAYIEVAISDYRNYFL